MHSFYNLKVIFFDLLLFISNLYYFRLYKLKYFSFKTNKTCELYTYFLILNSQYAFIRRTIIPDKYTTFVGIPKYYVVVMAISVVSEHKISVKYFSDTQCWEEGRWEKAKKWHERAEWTFYSLCLIKLSPSECPKPDGRGRDVKICSITLVEWMSEHLRNPT